MQKAEVAIQCKCSIGLKSVSIWTEARIAK